MFLLTTTFLTLTCFGFFVPPPVIEAKTFTLTRLICEVRDRDFCIVKKCSLDKSPEGVMMMNVHVQPLQPLDNITIRVKFLRKNNNVYRKFYYETLIDACDFLKTYKRQVPWGIMYQALLPYTNVNHTCPFNHDLIVSDLGMVGQTFEAIPLPNGDYLLNMMVLKNKVEKFEVQIYLVRK